MINTKILASLMLVGVASAGVGYGTYAAFSDTEQSSNIFGTGTLDLVLNGGAAVTNAFIGGANWAPGDAATGTIVLKNAGSILQGDAQSHQVRLVLAFQNTNARLSKYIEVQSLQYGSTLADIRPAESGTDANAWLDLAEIATGTAVSPLVVTDPGAAGKDLKLVVRLHPSTTNTDTEGDSTVNLQGATNTLRVVMTLQQYPSDAPAAIDAQPQP